MSVNKWDIKQLLEKVEEKGAEHKKEINEVYCQTKMWGIQMELSTDQRVILL